MSSFASLTLWNNIAELARVENFVTEFCSQHGIAQAELNLVAEECFVNIVEHGFDDRSQHSIQLSLELADYTVTMTLEDDGAAFDPLSVPEFDPTTPFEQRRVGGLGIYLVRSLVDEVLYQRFDGKNKLSLRKSVERKPTP